MILPLAFLQWLCLLSLINLTSQPPWNSDQAPPSLHPPVDVVRELIDGVRPWAVTTVLPTTQRHCGTSSGLRESHLQQRQPTSLTFFFPARP
nr:hypothetical protein Iba_contig4268CG0010 [Ipomoea batatas]GME06535.1 hypothetical protein Iba_scaffold4346CG0360 [Ipomoea batatas]GME06536.1 hypothetical protein Iba_scaffold4346CG0370 [Ipomoea batatas]GME09525.1 hypothetical protein Iba_scaffold8855CG0010 [Ipomoea batatas]